jgi:tRNA dimethylallyltransferase
MYPSSMKNPVLILSGPTASGKTDTALAIAQYLPIEIISADSRQVYKYLSVGTAKPDDGSLRKVPHHFVDILTPDQEWNAGLFSAGSRNLIAEIFRTDKIPVIVGGTGLYIKSLIDGIIDLPPADPSIRRELQAAIETGGLAVLVQELSRVDPDAALHTDIRNPRRVIRALEIFRQTGMTRAKIRMKTMPLEYPVLWFGLNWRRDELYRRIEKRVESMLGRGLVNEVRVISERGYDRSLNALQTVGYVEVFDYLENKIDYTEMVRLIKRNTRRFAKRQWTWFRKEPRIKWIEVHGSTNLQSIAAYIADEYKKASGLSS